MEEGWLHRDAFNASPHPSQSSVETFDDLPQSMAYQSDSSTSTRSGGSGTDQDSASSATSSMLTSTSSLGSTSVTRSASGKMEGNEGEDFNLHLPNFEDLEDSSSRSSTSKEGIINSDSDISDISVSIIC